jgi:group II intron reverse transcriptase/maturase
MQDTNVYLELIQERGKRGLPLERVYRQLFNKKLYLTAYGKIYRNAGAMTPGSTSETVDSMSLDKIDTIIEALRYERYRWKPARRVYIEKKHSTKKRPLGMPTWSDKLLQEVMRMILNAYYEPQFSKHSHGFRPERGCHTALREIYHNWQGTTWFIEGDISQCFDSFDHELLISTLSERIHDGRFLNLVRELLQAGYMEEWTFNQTLSGTPQGGIISPILANILLDKLDKFVETVLIPKYTKGGRRTPNYEYHRLIAKSRRLRKKGQAAEADALRKQAQKMPSIDPTDPDYRRLRYVRYADDFLLGFTGPRSEAEEIKQQLGAFLREELKLELSKTKTLITHARSEAARFLGYEVTVFQQDAKRSPRVTEGTRTKIRSVNGGIGLRVPLDVLEEKCNRYKKNGKVVHRAELINDSDFTIIATYQLEYRGITNYYRLAYNMHQLRQLRWVMEQSLTKTLAAKFKKSVSKIYDQYGVRLEVDGKQYKGLQTAIPREGKEPLVATWGGIPLVWDIGADLEDQPQRAWGGRTELEKRLLAQVCELCGITHIIDQIEVHHIRALKDLNRYTGREKPEWVKRMAARHRKTLVLCRTCHQDITYGRPMRRQSIKLKDVTALQKARTTMLESRMP